MNVLLLILLVSLCHIASSLEPLSGTPLQSPRFRCFKDYVLVDESEKRSKSGSCPDGQLYTGRDETCGNISLECFKNKFPTTHCIPNTASRPSCFEMAFSELRIPHCSIGVQDVQCSAAGKDMELSFVVDTKGKTHWIKDVHVQLVESVSTKPYFSLGNNKDPSKVSCHPAIADKNYMPGACAISYEESKGYIYPDPSYSTLALKSRDCVIPILCYGHATVRVFPFLESADYSREDKLMILKCGKSLIEVSFLTDTATHVDTCGASECHRAKVSNKRVSIKRTTTEKIHDDKVDVTSLGPKGKITSEVIACPRLGVCEAVDCSFCWSEFLNLHCWNASEWAMYTSCFYVLVVLFSALMGTVSPILKLTLFFFKIWYYLFYYIWSKIRSRANRLKKGARTSSDALARYYSKDGEEDVSVEMESVLSYNPKKEEREPFIKSAKRTLFPSRPQGRVRPGTLAMAIVMVLLMPLKTIKGDSVCQITQATAGSITRCSGPEHEKLCAIGYWSEMELSGAGGQSCLQVLRKDGLSVITIEMRTKEASFMCNKMTKYFSRDVEYKIESLKHCPSVGFCSGDQCAKVDSYTRLPFMSNSSFEGPGKSYCELIPGCAANGCFLCSSACVAWRWFAHAINDNVYEFFECPSWRPHLTLHVTQKIGDHTSEFEVALTHGRPYLVGDLTFTMDMILESQVPVFSKSFVQGFDNQVSIVDSLPAGQQVKGRLGQMQCQTTMAATGLRDCIIPQDVCDCHYVGGLSCDCVNVNPKSVFVPTATLPLRAGDIRFFTRGMEVHAEVATVARAKVTVTGKGFIKQTDERAAACSIKINSVEGCFNCLQGVNVKYNCRSRKEQTLILHCRTTNLTITCSDAEVERVAHFLSSYPTIRDKCVSGCSGADSIPLEGSLEFHGFTQLTNSSRVRVLNSNTTSTFAIQWSMGALWSFSWIKWIVFAATLLALIIFCILTHRFFIGPLLRKVVRKKEE